MNTLTQRIKALSGASDEEIEIFYNASKVVDLSKGEVLLGAGKLCNHYYFIESGVIRIYYEKEGKEHTLWFASAGEMFTHWDSYNNQVPSYHIYKALESTRVRIISKTANERLAKEYPFYNTLLRKNLEEVHIHTCKNISAYQSDSALERYEKLEVQHNWLLRFPLKYISSFLGVTESSLSRIRKTRK
ncbi:MAG: Crp/Fnr family transcriptional regulator [Thermonemataceae bacterium]